MDVINAIEYITNWLDEYSEKSNTNGYVIGVSGGIDSAVTSTLAARTGRSLLCVEMPIHQAISQVNRASDHIDWLMKKFPNVRRKQVPLTDTFETIKKAFGPSDSDNYDLALANTRARLRMTTLYYHAGLEGKLVVGTGNKVEDFGVGFFTKYGDGGVDLSPIADLMKSEVYALAKELGIIDSIQHAAPTDGLFGDNRTDEDQIGASYPELEETMKYIENGGSNPEDLEGRKRKVYEIYTKLHRANLHKMNPIPVCNIPSEIRQ